MKLSKREKNLIFFLILLVISLAFLKFIILPTYKEYKTTMMTVSQYSDKIEEIEIAKSSIETQRKETIELEKLFNEASENYYSLRSKKEIHELINSIMLTTNISPTDFLINEPVLVETVDAASLIYSSKISINAVGNYVSVKNIIDYFYSTSSIQINNFSIDKVQDILNDSMDAKLSIDITLYMYDGVE